jgi:biotin carboxyl carrier protein
VVGLQTYRVQTIERSYTVTLEPKNKRECVATVNSAVINCACDRIQEIAVWAITREGKRIHAKSRSLGLDKVEIWVGGLSFQFSVTPVAPGREEVAKPIPRIESGEIRAIMPGRVTSILVKLGDEVSVGAPLLILEAMKMQNEIVSHKSGRVTSVKVQEGATVKKDAVLIEVH